MTGASDDLRALNASDPPGRQLPDPGEVRDAYDDLVVQVAGAIAEPMPRRRRFERMFATRSFRRLWFAQVVASLGDWVGFAAIAVLAARIGMQSPGTAIAMVLSVRLIPGFFLGPLCGVVADRLDRRKLMIFANVGRGAVFAFLPFVDNLPTLVLASFLLELLTLLWSPAKEATVPNLVPAEYLPRANSLGLIAAYGTFPLGSLVFALCAQGATALNGIDALSELDADQVFVAMWFNMFTFFASALMIVGISLGPDLRTNAALPARRTERRHLSHEVRRALSDLNEGWRYVRGNRAARSILLCLGTGLVGGGMLVPLGSIFSEQVLAAGPSGFGLLLTALGCGLAVGILGLGIAVRRLPPERTFVVAVLAAGACIIGAASMHTIIPALAFVAALGLCAGAVYALGFAIVQANVTDEVRGRVFAMLYTTVRMCVLLAFAVAPLLSDVLDRTSASLFDRSIELAGIDIALPGVRITMWIAGAIIVVAGLVARKGLGVSITRRRVASAA